MNLREPSALKSFLKSAGRATIARAQWLALGLLIGVGMFSFWNTSALIATNISEVRLRKLRYELQEFVSTVTDAETGQRGYLLVGETSYLEPYLAALKVADQQNDRVEKLMLALPDRQATFAEMQQLVDLKLAELKSTIQLRQSEGFEAAVQVVRTDQGQKLMGEIRGLATQIKQEIQDRLAEYDEQTVGLAMRATLWSTLGSVMVAVLFVLVIQRELRERARVEEKAQELVRSAEASAIHTLEQADGKFEALGQQAGELARSVEAIRIQAAAQSERQIEPLGQTSQDLAGEIETLVDQAKDLARSVEGSRIKALDQSDKKIEALEQHAWELARSVEVSRIEALDRSDKEIDGLGQQARELATFVESSRVQTLMRSDGKIEALRQQARDLATSMETSRVQTLDRSEKEIESLGQQARDLAVSMETSRIETLDRSDREVEALGQQARELAAFVEKLRAQTLKQSDGKIEALGQQARELATFVETSRIQALGQSNKQIRKLNEELEQRVLDRTSQLEAANRELDAFSYSISHDLRAPLRAIDGFSRIVLEDFSAPMESAGKAYLKMVRDNTQQMGQLVDDLLAFARLGRQSLTKQTVEVDNMVRRCLEGMVTEQQGRQVEIVIGDLRACQADAALLKQVWTNLLANALKYTRKREVARIEIGSRIEPRLAADGQPLLNGDAGSEVVYFVKDNGAGFDMKHAGKLFGVFQRLHGSAEYEGTGVGLAFVQRIVHRHGGRIWAQAEVDHGATFSFTLD